MAKKRKKEIKSKKIAEEKNPLQEDTLQGVLSVFFFVLALFFLMASLGVAGRVGKEVYLLLYSFLGIGYFLLPLLLCAVSATYFFSTSRKIPIMRIVGAVICFVSGLGILSLIKTTEGGVVGDLIDTPLVALFDWYASLIFLSGLMLISLFVLFDTRLKREHIAYLPSLLKKKTDLQTVPQNSEYILGDESKKYESIARESSKDQFKIKGDIAEEEKEIEIKKPKKNEAAEEIQVMPKEFSFHAMLGKAFVPPPLSILEKDKGKPGVGDIKANANIIKRTLQNFGINVEMDEISIGPSVTRYALKPAEGVKLSRIAGLQSNLALALAAQSIRIEAPIPGKSLVGIEIPNSVKTMVGLGTLLATDEFQNSDKSLLVALGKGISGKSHYDNISEMPHLLIAGTTGSGKSVTIHAIITSLLYRNSPENLRFIMIDPKRVELTLYNKIPHLLTPVITDAKKAILSLKWAAKEMDRRYDILEKYSVRDIGSYHKTILAPALKKLEQKKDVTETADGPETMPYIVVIIDELADIMQTYPRELEAGIVRLAQMSRAVGIHLILSTQRPSVNVITGLIKANVPSRLALQVASQIDSRTILDMPGAEKLLGHGDMLYLSSKTPNPQRIQCAFISEDEVKNVVKYLVDNYESLPSEITLGGDNPGGVSGKDPVFESSFDSNDDAGDDDEMYAQAREEVLKAGKASTSYIQRKLRVGYARAARIMDMLEERGVIGPPDGAKPREVISYETKASSAESSE